jgi:hypothetical protein
MKVFFARRRGRAEREMAIILRNVAKTHSICIKHTHFVVFLPYYIWLFQKLVVLLRRFSHQSYTFVCAHGLQVFVTQEFLEII